MILKGETRQQFKDRLTTPHRRFVFLAPLLSGDLAVLQKVWASADLQGGLETWRYALTEAELVEPVAPSSPPPMDSAGRSEPLGVLCGPPPLAWDSTLREWRRGPLSDPSKPLSSSVKVDQDLIEHVAEQIFEAMQFARDKWLPKGWAVRGNSAAQGEARFRARAILADLFPTPDDGDQS